MSTVLFSSIGGERLASRKNVPQEIASQLKRTGTCRNLFGPVDHDELRRELASKLREISERDQQRWNFNFSEGQPLDGDLKWEESPAEGCPLFYRETTLIAIKRQIVDFPTTERIINVDTKCESSLKIRKSQTQRRKFSRKRVQTKSQTNMRITDFYGKRKRTDVCKERRTME
ncbi:cyclin-dependent kinase inhibitor 1B [Danio aesculapii]|uniref:cyclin-dependent kinase inhibitor 1B n=1 Tax=Danio aesculapii TaxID=1142201 RepID=UPI0024C0C08C|nr:cyclin-dependent kinase inhibitor 1B [Danio aesculapii]